MFTGIIQSVGKIAAVHGKGEDMRLKIDVGGLDMKNTQLGDSIATSGVCLTVIEMGKNYFMADVSKESLKRTTLGKLRIGSLVNLEKALELSSPLGGHLVSGHVDGVGEVVAFADLGESWKLTVRAPQTLAKYIAVKGSITINGVSLTVNEVDGAVFSVNLIPHTLAVTTLNELRAGASVNLEIDLIARYVERMLACG